LRRRLPPRRPQDAAAGNGAPLSAQPRHHAAHRYPTPDSRPRPSCLLGRYVMTCPVRRSPFPPDASPRSSHVNGRPDGLCLSCPEGGVTATAISATPRSDTASAEPIAPIRAATWSNIASPPGQRSAPGGGIQAIPIDRGGGPRLSSTRFFPQSPAHRARRNVRVVPGIAERTLSIARKVIPSMTRTASRSASVSSASSRTMSRKASASHRPRPKIACWRQGPGSLAASARIQPVLRGSFPKSPSRNRPAEAATRSWPNNGRIRAFTSRSEDAQSSSVVPINAPAIHDPPNHGDL